MAKMILAELCASLFPDDPPLPGWQTLSNSDAEIWRQEHGVKGGLREIQEHYRRTLLYGADHAPDVDFSDGHEPTFAEIVELTADRPGTTMVVCPDCHPEHYQPDGDAEVEKPRLTRRDRPPNRALMVMRRRFDEATYECKYCGSKGSVTLDETPDPDAAALWRKWHRIVQAEERAERTADAMKIWSDCVPITGTRAEVYLEQRGITELPPNVDDVLRFHRRCRFGLEEAEAMVALYRDPVTGNPTGVHRTKLPTVNWLPWRRTERRELGAQGAIQLWPASGNRLVVGEGIETVLSAAQAFTDPIIGEPLRPAWAFGPAENLERFCVPIPGIERLVILVDHDKNRRCQDAAEKVKDAWELQGCSDVTLIMPPEPGTDFNDLLLDQLEAAR
jgi:putative DNA primase/helicase